MACGFNFMSDKSNSRQDTEGRHAEFMKPKESNQTELMPSEKPAQALVKHDQVEFPAVNIEALMNKAIEKGASEAVGVMERLTAMRREIQLERSEQAFNEDMTLFQSDCPIIIKDKKGAEGHYKYSPIESIETQIRPFEQKYGFNHRFDQDTESKPGEVICICIVTHRFGHSKQSRVKLRLVRKTALISDAQQDFGTITSGNRRALQNAYGLVVAGEDMDAAGKMKGSSSGRVVTPAIRTRFFAVIKEKGLNDKLQAYAIDKAWIMPDEGLDKIKDENVPTMKTELESLLQKVEAMP